MKILLIEDDIDTRSYIKQRLRARGCIVEEASDGKRGLGMARAGSYDIILLDYGLPEKNGFQVSRELRDHNINTPIVIISVMTETLTKIECLNVGADDYVTKPFFFDELYSRIIAILRRPQMRNIPVLTIGDLRVDLGKQQVTRDNKIIHLTRKEFSLLEYLARHAEQVIPRTELAERVWETEMNPFSNTIETHVLNLRKKIDYDYEIPLIHNVTGRGYRLGVNEPIS